MAIETISGVQKYRINPYNARLIEVQRRHGARWQRYAHCESEEDATDLVLLLARDVKGMAVREED